MAAFTPATGQDLLGKDATAVQSRNEVLRLKAPTAPHFPPRAPQTAPLKLALA